MNMYYTLTVYMLFFFYLNFNLFLKVYTHQLVKAARLTCYIQEIMELLCTFFPVVLHFSFSLHIDKKWAYFV